MCGIFGAIRVDVSNNIETIVKSLQRRGPDGYGVYSDNDTSTTLIHTRLSIIDTSTSANQPMEYGDYVITFNGEIYNYKEIRKELIDKGYIFKTNSDTEVILVSYIEWGEKFLTKLRGMFSLGIWNKIDKTFFAARDYFGVKPFYYYTKNDGVIFSSLLTTLLATNIPSKKINLTGVAIYLQTGSFTGEHTIVENIQQLPPAHFLKMSDGIFEIKPYWNLNEEIKKIKKPSNYNDAKKQLRNNLEESAQCQLVSDVPVGAFLSAGIDSSIAVGLLSKFSTTPINTFTVGFEKKHIALNELDGARLIANKFKTNHNELILKDNLIDESIEDYINAIDQPSIDGLNTYFISRETAKYTKVAVTGLGSDEVFGGYSHFLYASISDRLFSKGLIANVKMPNLFKSIPDRFKELIIYILSTSESRHTLIRNYGNLHPIINKLINLSEDEKSIILKQYYSGYTARGLDAIQELSWWEINKYLLNTLLRDGDALSMSQSLEVRPMFLDHKLVTYAYSLNSEYKVQWYRKKRILIDSCKDLLLPEIFNKKKTGFELPLKYWLNNNLKFDYLNLLESKNASNLFSKKYLNYLKDCLQNNNLNNSHWSIYILLKFINTHSIITAYEQ